MLQDPTKEQMIDFLRSTIFAHEDGFEDEIEVAIYYFARDYHSGQSSNLYSALSTSPYSPGLTDELGNDGMLDDLYAELVCKFDREETVPTCICCKGDMEVDKPHIRYICGQRKPYQNVCSETCLEDILKSRPGLIKDEQIDDRDDEFSSRPCECCNSELAGERWFRSQVVYGYGVEGFDSDKRPIYVDSVCVDCKDAILE